MPIFNATKASNLNPLSAMGLHLPPHLLNAINPGKPYVHNNLRNPGSLMFISCQFVNKKLLPGQNLDQIEDELSEMLFGSEEDSAENINLST